MMNRNKILPSRSRAASMMKYAGLLLLAISVIPITLMFGACAPKEPTSAASTISMGNRVIIDWHDGNGWHIMVIDLTTGQKLNDVSTGDTEPSVHLTNDRAVIDWHDGNGWHIKVINLTTGKELGNFSTGDTEPSVHLTNDRAVIDWHDGSGWHIKVINLTTGEELSDVSTGDKTPSVDMAQNR